MARVERPGTEGGSVGFTGTRRGMTEAQKNTLRDWLRHTAPLFFHHGDCIGADQQAHEIAANLGIDIVLHPPLNPKYRAFCSKGVVQTFPEKEYLVRNVDIVEASGGSPIFDMFAAPSGYDEIMRGSGTWSTIRLAHASNVSLCVIWPSGSWSAWKDCA